MRDARYGCLRRTTEERVYKDENQLKIIFFIHDMHTLRVGHLGEKKVKLLNLILQKTIKCVSFSFFTVFRHTSTQLSHTLQWPLAC
jgi:hypothetical protein